MTFTANGPCGGSIVATLQLQDGAANLGTVNFTLPLGKLVPATNFVQKLRRALVAPAPARRAGPSFICRGSEQLGHGHQHFRFRVQLRFHARPDHQRRQRSEIRLRQHCFVFTAQLSFRHYYNLEDSPVQPLQAYDGGVLEISSNT